MSEIKTHYRACHLCEAICGLEIKTSGREIVSIKGDPKDPFSQGYICPKATALQDLHTDPDRLRKPVKKIVQPNGDIEWQEINWDEAIALSAAQLVSIQNESGKDAVGFYAGNPNVHNYGNLTHGALLRRAVGTKNNFSATSLDQLPHQLAALEMYGHQFFIPIPDIDHTDFFLILGGNPMASNGSLMTMPNARGRLKSLQQRGGSLVVIDPRFTETAQIADQHHFINPGSDAFLLLAMINIIIEQEWANCGAAGAYLCGLDQLQSAVKPFTAELAATQTGISTKVIHELAEKLASTPRSACYGRMGVSVQEFGGVCQWAIQVLNIITGSFDVTGGTLLTSPAFHPIVPGAPGKGHFDKFQSRVSGLPEFGGELPALAMAEEIMTPGDGQIKAMVTIAGNPVLSSVDATTLDAAFASLDFCLAIDFYINETTRHADVILPPTSPLEHDHYDIVFHRFAVRDTTRMNEAVFERDPESLHDWEILNQLSEKIAELKQEPFAALPAPDLIVAHGIENGPLGKDTDRNLTLDTIRLHPNGLDLGPLKTGMLQRLCTSDGKINLVPEIYLEDLPRLLDAAANKPTEGSLLLIGRRHVRSNNSWMHNYHRLTKGKPRWQLMMHPSDLETRSIEDGEQVIISSRAGSLQTMVQASEDIAPGVVCLPHGWGHQKNGVKLRIASVVEVEAA